MNTSGQQNSLFRNMDMELGQLSLDLAGASRENDIIESLMAFLAEHCPGTDLHVLFLFDSGYAPCCRGSWPEDQEQQAEKLLEACIDIGAVAQALQHGRYLTQTDDGRVVILRAVGTRGCDRGLYLGRAQSEKQAAHPHLDSMLTLSLTLTAQALENLALRQDALEQNERLQRAVDQRTAELTDALSVSQAAERSKSVFLATMSHEIRTPLNGIIGSLELLQDAEAFDERQQLITTAESCAQHLLALLNDILDLAKIDAGRSTSAQVAFDISALVRETLDGMRHQPAVREKNLDLAMQDHIGAQRWRLGDQVHVRQILFNLVGNAIKFTERGSVKITLQGDAEKLYIAVRDTGIGIKHDAIKYIFDPFRQADEKTHLSHGGTGLGLAISHRLAALMGGSLAVESEEGVGSTFTLELPIPLADDPTIAKPHSSSIQISQAHVAELRGLRVLIAEDNAVNRIVLRRMLERMGCAVAISEDGAEAWTCYQASPPHILLTDIEMPQWNGYQLAMAIREKEAEQGAKHLPIIALTAHTFAEHRQRAENSGIDDFIAKPVTIAELRAALLRWSPLAASTED